jgi:hypothetical protein
MVFHYRKKNSRDFIFRDFVVFFLELKLLNYLMKIMFVMKLLMLFEEIKVWLCYHHILFYFIFLKGKEKMNYLFRMFCLDYCQMNVLIDLLNFLVYQMQWKHLLVENKFKNDQQELKHLNL